LRRTFESGEVQGRQLLHEMQQLPRTEYLRRNGLLVRPDGTLRIETSGLAQIYRRFV
jgi:hypothetical protein